jgi:hypothetical protein
LLLDKVYDDNGPTFAAPIPNLCGICASDGGRGTVPALPAVTVRSPELGPQLSSDVSRTSAPEVQPPSIVQTLLPSGHARTTK